MAGESVALKASRKIKHARARRDFPRRKIRRQAIAGNTRQTLLRSAANLAHSSALGKQRCLPAPSHTFAPRDDWRAHDRVVSALSKMNGRTASVVPDKLMGRDGVRPSNAIVNLGDCRFYAPIWTTILWKPVTPENGLRSSSHSCTSPWPSVARTTMV